MVPEKMTSSKPPVKLHKRTGSNVISIASQSELILRKADELLDRGDHLGALKLYRRALSYTAPGTPEADDVLFAIADAYTEMGQTTDAIKTFAPLLVPGGDAFRLALLRLGNCLMMRGEYNAAMDAFGFCFDDRFAGDFELDDLFSVSDAEELCMSYIEQEEAKEKALRDLDELEIERISEKASKLGEAAEFEQAMAILEPAHEKYPDSPRLFADLLLACFCAQRYEDGLRFYHAASEKLRGELVAQCCAAMFCHYLARAEEEEELVRMISSVESNDLNELVRAYTCTMEIERYGIALRFAEHLLELDPYNRTFIHFTAHAAYCLGNFKRAKEYYDTCLQIEPHDAAAHYYRGLCENTLAGDGPGAMQIDYVVPHSEFIARCEYTRMISERFASDPVSAWNDERERILLMTDWALTDRNCPFADFYLLLILYSDPELAEGLLRALLVEPGTSQKMRDLAAARLHSVVTMRSQCSSFLIFDKNSRLRLCTFERPKKLSYMPPCYKRILTAVVEELKKTDPDLVEDGEELLVSFVKAYAAERPVLPYGQEQATAAAIVYVLLEREGKAPDLRTFAAAHGVTARRIENAIKRIANALAGNDPAAHSGDKDDDE